tara:strand:- start:581 stop:1096 length:516 start_codon:yes stop_codon:yes gene_type:complete
MSRKTTFKALVIYDMGKIDKVLTRAVKDGMNAIAIKFGANLTGSQGTLSRPGTGKHYKGNPARSSKPGESPVVQTNRLRLSWTTKMPNPVKVRGRYIARIGQHQNLMGGGGASSPVKYGKWLEEGTSKMAARPYLNRGKKPGAIQLTQRVAKKVFMAEFNIGLQKANGLVK